ncbi:hypothetical protein SDC9_200114 [bioreactor metagenome]|uniref:Uncharacterized protein n=1 Tax=bioreactor metagenome TaxID=1076179 RepID=A0A645INL9_9ZZZZ
MGLLGCSVGYGDVNCEDKDVEGEIADPHDFIMEPVSVYYLAEGQQNRDEQPAGCKKKFCLA